MVLLHPDLAAGEEVPVHGLGVHACAGAGSVRRPVGPLVDDHGILEVLVEVVDVLDETLRVVTRDGGGVEEGVVLDQLAQPHSPACRHNRTPNLAGRRRIAKVAFTPPTGVASRWRASTASALR